MSKFFITSAIPYVNAKPHIGHALEFIQTDVIARHRRIMGDDVLKLSGGDENAMKNVQAAEAVGVPIQEFIDTNTDHFYDLANKLNASFDVWQKGSDIVHHYKSSQKLWNLCSKNGDIYQETYKGLYCVGCEAFYPSDELNENGECFEHPGKKLEAVEEKNYFFRLSRYKEPLRKLIKDGVLEIVPENRKNEVLSFLENDLRDISISRSNLRAKNWGVPVPEDDSQKIYVWFDALNIYQSGVGYGWNEDLYKKWWPADLHVIGKGILRFHAVYWPAFLLSAGLKLPKKILVHEYFTVNGQKMSKTLGNVFDPMPLLIKFGADPLRYYCLAKISPFSDGDFSEDKFYGAYNSDLVNGISNLAARVASLCEKHPEYRYNPEDDSESLWNDILPEIEAFRFDRALSLIWGTVSGTDSYLSKERPWLKDLSDENQRLGNHIILSTAISSLRQIAKCLRPFLPETAEKLFKMFEGPKIKRGENLFTRLA